MDGRRARGDRTRDRVVRRAAEIASIEGLESLSLGQLSTDLGLSKSGVAAAFGTKQELQLATVAAAREIFVEHVVVPALAEPEGLPRLRAAIDAWLRYVHDGVFPGGCFMVAVMPEFDSRSGPVRDALAAARDEWLTFLAEQVKLARDDGASISLVPEDAAFEIDAVLAAANLSRNLSDDASALERARTILHQRLDISPPATRKRRTRKR